MSTLENERDEQDKDVKPPTTADSESETKAAKPAAADEDDAREDDEEEEEAPKANHRSGALHTDAASAVAAEGPGLSIVRNTLTIAKREARSYFDSLIAYVVIGGSTLALGIYFFLIQQGGFWQVDRASMTRMFEFLPWMLAALVIPLVTMRSIADEKRSGTLELLITLPVRDSEVILGKYFAALFMCAVLLLITLIYPIAMFAWPWRLGVLDWGPVWTGYFGLLLFSGAGVAVGMLFSSLTESQIIAFFLSAFTLLLLLIIGMLVETLPGAVGDAIAFISFQTRFTPFSRGLIDTRAIIYFVSIGVICLLAAFRSLESRKWS
ncbi:ABC transporter permease subunit [Pendulispora rubella]|uniref:ABC transporter permease subunit n=1 Tax=Pendulispora rubella TaxID=2741070 RepID=A0ABZ2L0A9_9BACT